MQQEVGIPKAVLNRSDFVLAALHAWILENNGIPYVVVNTMIEGVVADPKLTNKDGMIVYNLSPNSAANLSINEGWVSFDARFNGKSMNITFPCIAVSLIYDRDQPHIQEPVNFAEVQQWVIENGGAQGSVKAADKPIVEEKPKRENFLRVVK